MTVWHALWKLALLTVTLAALPSSLALPASTIDSLITRDTRNTCGNGLPSDWSCSSTSTCLPLNNTGTQAAICCPTADSSQCSTIAPISCDISKQNATANPNSSLFTEDLSRQLISCGQDSCCPLGYSCSGNTCVMDDETKAAEGATSSSTAVAPSTTTSATATSTTPSAVSAAPSFVVPDSSSPSQQTPVPQNSSDFPPQAVLAGFFPGIILGALICACIFFLLRRRSMKRMAQDAEGEFGDFGHTPGGGIVRSTHLRPYLMRSTRHKHKISDPIYDHSLSNRSVFLKHSRSSPEMSKNGFPRTPSQRNKRWYRSPRLGVGTWDSSEPTLGNPTPEVTRRIRPRLNVVTPTPPPRNAPEHQHLTPSVPGLAVTTRNGGRVSNLLKPLSPSFQKAKNFGTLKPRTKSPTLPEFKLPSQPRPGASASRSNSNKSATTIATSSRSNSGTKHSHSRHSTNASTGTIDFLLAPQTGSMGGTFPFSSSDSPPQSRGKGRAVDKTPPQREPPRLGAPWQTPTIPESPDRQAFRGTTSEGSPEIRVFTTEDKGKESRPVTTFTTLMLDAGGNMPSVKGHRRK